jgi:hypothetical protein
MSIVPPASWLHLYCWQPRPTPQPFQRSALSCSYVYHLHIGCYCCRCGVVLSATCVASS